ncbi:MAG: CBS domain-containing protein [Deltaproteobacteria bacterium]|nr:CBS domain-containing protein [Deltaproteobacteria bacterium]
MELRKALKQAKIKHLRMRPALIVESGTPLKEVVQRMQKEKKGSALIQKKGALVGIFTERDALTKIVTESQELVSSPIDRFMTPKPKTIRMDDSIATAIQIMSKGGYRRLPILKEGGVICGLISTSDIIMYLAEHFPYEVLNLPPDPHQEQKSPDGA